MPRENRITPKYQNTERIKSGSGIHHICSICKEHIDEILESDSDNEMEGAGYLSNFAEKVEKKARKGASKVKKTGKKVGKYVTSTDADAGLASDLITYGVPATTGALLGAVGSLANPVAGVASSAVGSKLGAVIGEELKDELLKDKKGSGVKRKPRYAKGSDEAKEWAKKMREAKLAKKK